MWTNLFSEVGATFGYASAIVTDGDANAFVTGWCNTTNIVTGTDFLTIKYSASGVPCWTNRYANHGYGDDQAMAIAIDLSSNVVVAGYSDWTNGLRDFAIIKYSNLGVPIWTNRYSHSEQTYEVPNAIAIDSSNNVIVTGGSGIPGPSSIEDCVTVAYSADGIGLWTNRYAGPEVGWTFGRDVAVSKTGDVFVVGSSWGGDSLHDYFTIKYSPSAAPALLSIGNFGNSCVLGWSDPAFSLQTAPTVNGAFTNIPGATSPYTNPITGGQQFFRLNPN
jgi:hypothetical protein